MNTAAHVRGSPVKRGHPPRFVAAAFLVVQIGSPTLEGAADIASWMNRSNVFWSVLALLLGGGCVYYLFQWLYLRKVQAHQEKLKALYMLAEGLIPTDRPSAILSQIAEVIPLISQATHCSIWILNPANQKLEFGAGSARPASSSVSLSAITGPVTCFRNQALTEVADAQDCPFVDKEAVRRLGQKSLLYVPIMADRVCLGVIEIEDRNRKLLFPNEQKAAVEHVAKLAALALWQRAQNSLKEQIHRTEKMATMGEFIDGISNELARPLAAISNMAQRLKENPQSGAMPAAVDLIGREARQAAEALGRLLKFAKPQHSRLKTFDLNAMLDRMSEAIRQQWKARGLKVRFELSKRSAVVAADPDHLEEILANIFRHAERFLEGIGRSSLDVFTDVLERQVLISMTPSGAPQASAHNRRPASLDVDNDEEESVGGLGLAVCRSLIEGGGGALRVDQGSSRGFHIEIHYPLAREGWSGAPRPVEERETQRPKVAALALVMDEDPETQDTLLQYLTDRGHRVIVAETVEEGIDLAERTDCDWVFCKIQVGRMSGLEVYTRLQNRAEKFVFLAEEKTLIFNEELFSGEDRFILRKPIKGADVDRLLDGLEQRPVSVGERKPAEV